MHKIYIEFRNNDYSYIKASKAERESAIKSSRADAEVCLKTCILCICI